VVLELEWEEDRCAVLMEGGDGDCTGLAMHPDPDARLVASVSSAGLVYVRDTRERRLRCKFAVPPTKVQAARGQSARAWRCAFSHRAPYMLAVSTASAEDAESAADAAGLPLEKRGGGLVVFRLDAKDLAAAEAALPAAADDDAAAVAGDGPWGMAAAPTVLFPHADSDAGLLEALQFSPDDRYLAVGGHGRVIDVYRCPHPNAAEEQDGAAAIWRRVSRCEGHSSTVLHLDWAALDDVADEAEERGVAEAGSGDGDGGAGGTVAAPTPPPSGSVDHAAYILRSVSADHDILCWHPTAARWGQQLLHNQRDRRWHSWSSHLGWEVMGIWPASADGLPMGGEKTVQDPSTQILACARSPCERYVCTADGAGGVRLLHFPCVVAHAPALVRTGHSSMVSACAWSARPDINRPGGVLDTTTDDDEGAVMEVGCVVTAGGHDGATLQWRTMLPADADDAQKAEVRAAAGQPSSGTLSPAQRKLEALSAEELAEMLSGAIDEARAWLRDGPRPDVASRSESLGYHLRAISIRAGILN
jgi:hypothetical protein